MDLTGRGSHSGHFSDKERRESKRASKNRSKTFYFKI